jgi:hypothetical protein
VSLIINLAMAALGVGPVGATPVTLDDFKFSILFDAAP